MNIRWAPQHLVCKASQKDNTAVQSQGSLFFVDGSSLPLVLQIFKGHPLITMITVQNIGKGLEVVASPADPRLLRYVSLAWKL